MIPYFTVPRLHIFGPFAVEPFGALVVAGIGIGAWLALRRAEQAGIPQKEMTGAIQWSLVGGLLGAHIYYVLANRPELLGEKGPVVLLRFWDGMSSFGGFSGALIGAAIYFAYLKKDWTRHADILVQALVVGWVLGRLGCTIAHDHPGVSSDFVLAFNYPAGPAHNLGFYEMLFTLLVLLPAVLLIHRAGARPGTATIAVIALYAPFRFTLEFLRDANSSGPNIEQVLSAVMLGIALRMHLKSGRSGAKGSGRCAVAK
ncbi:MAG: prolipoprotein diacylglyceryl transferase [Acidobacteria bacterium]|nr:prolipoprotein diacylglyceryl transferase [Acidobacteriota bacterium]MCW5967894.1 prolipoprotein diacylglyceryl transferase [Blastocatellales bacterium]